MNKHLKPLFEKVFPVFEKSNIDYWLYGGVAVAAVNSHWIRNNKDLDVAVLYQDFEKTVSLLNNIVLANKWSIRLSHLRNGRPKLDLYLDLSAEKGKEKLSLTPLYKTGNQIEFKFGSKIILPISVLERQKRKIENYSFVTFTDKYIKELLIHYLKHHKVKPGDKKYKDAVAILSKEEILRFIPNS